MAVSHLQNLTPPKNRFGEAVHPQDFWIWYSVLEDPRACFHMLISRSESGDGDTKSDRDGIDEIRG